MARGLARHLHACVSSIRMTPQGMHVSPLWAPKCSDGHRSWGGSFAGGFAACVLACLCVMAWWHSVVARLGVRFGCGTRARCAHQVSCHEGEPQPSALGLRGKGLRFMWLCVRTWCHSPEAWFQEASWHGFWHGFLAWIRVMPWLPVARECVDSDPPRVLHLRIYSRRNRRATPRHSSLPSQIPPLSCDK